MNQSLLHVAYPSQYGPDIMPPHRDQLEFNKFHYGQSYWFQKLNWWMQNHKSSKLEWQYWNTKPFKTLLDNRPGVIVDVGANIGMTSVQFANWGYEVLAFEPAPETCKLLAHNLCINGVSDKVTIYQNAVSDRCYITTIRDQANYSGVSRLVDAASNNPNVKSTFHQVNAVTLDSLELPKVAGIKIDVEGDEFAVVRGVDRVIKQDRPVILLELLGDSATGRGLFKWQPQDVLDYFARLDYHAYNKKLIKTRTWKYKRNYSDYLFVPAESDPVDNPLFDIPDK